MRGHGFFKREDRIDHRISGGLPQRLNQPFHLDRRSRPDATTCPCEPQTEHGSGSSGEAGQFPSFATMRARSELVVAFLSGQRWTCRRCTPSRLHGMQRGCARDGHHRWGPARDPPQTRPLPSDASTKSSAWRSMGVPPKDRMMSAFPADAVAQTRSTPAHRHSCSAAVPTPPPPP